VTRVQQASWALKNVTLTQQGAPIGPTPLPIGNLQAGLYRVSWYLRITQAASSSSSVTVTIGWNDGGPLQLSGAPVTGNTTATVQSGMFFIHITAAPITYSTAYASVGATPMQYALLLALESVGA
jgi:hypothetical protein